MSGLDSEIVEDCCKALEAKAAAGWLFSAQHVRPLMQQARLMLDRLQVDPSGGDIINAHECAIEFLRHRAETAEAELVAAREAHAETERDLRDKISVLEEQNDALGDANEAQVQRDEALAECEILRTKLGMERIRVAQMASQNERAVVVAEMAAEHSERATHMTEAAQSEITRLTYRESYLLTLFEGSQQAEKQRLQERNKARAEAAKWEIACRAQAADAGSIKDDLIDAEAERDAAREELKKALHPDTAVRVVANVDGHHPLVSTYLTGNEVELLRWLATRIAEQPFVQARTPMYGMALEVLDKVAKRRG